MQDEGDSLAFGRERVENAVRAGQRVRVRVRERQSVTTDY